jgi:large subunit ribosomal protein L6
MSRVGKAPIVLTEGVTVEKKNDQITVKGPKGSLSRSLPRRIVIETEGNSIQVLRPSDEIEDRALHGLTRSLIANMVEGVAQGFKKTLELYGVGYRAQVQGKRLAMQLGFSHPVEIAAPEGIEFAAESFVPTGENNYLCARITVSGIDKGLVGQIAADIRASKKPEPYKGKGIRYQGERVRRKPGKAAKAQA